MLRRINLTQKHFNSTKVQFGVVLVDNDTVDDTDFNSTKVQFGVTVSGILADYTTYFNSTKVQFGGRAAVLCRVYLVFQFH